jgi:hypothetical protein
MRRELPSEHQRKHWAEQKERPPDVRAGDRSQERNGTREENYRLVMDESNWPRSSRGKREGLD